MRQIIFFKTDQGTAPVAEFLDSLSSKQAQKMVWVMKLVEELPKVPSQYFKKLTGTEIWEIRAQVGSDTFRVLGFFMSDAKFIVTNGFQKKSMAVPKTEITIAEKRRQRYLMH
jgi:phage-related protein